MNLAASETETCGNHFHSVQATTFSEKLNKALRMKAGLQTRSIQLRATNKKLQRHKKRCICVNISMYHICLQLLYYLNELLYFLPAANQLYGHHTFGNLI
uniref:AlNc14C98G5957 protein n=1 Tax=Albugo laibachii Nc14 TaxID=890382 RepID=F0WH92_9STRA|nr:AlNc14C98G5957 [Albugo laibachii Nc14]|eukprot:CCA20607.1 AlNc14C98G5957 [Albugo laibachii Nc14]